MPEALTNENQIDLGWTQKGEKLGKQYSSIQSAAKAKMLLRIIWIISHLYVHKLPMAMDKVCILCM